MLLFYPSPPPDFLEQQKTVQGTCTARAGSSWGREHPCHEDCPPAHTAIWDLWGSWAGLGPYSIRGPPFPHPQFLGWGNVGLGCLSCSFWVLLSRRLAKGEEASFTIGTQPALPLKNLAIKLQGKETPHSTGAPFPQPLDNGSQQLQQSCLAPHFTAPGIGKERGKGAPMPWTWADPHPPNL